MAAAFPKDVKTEDPFISVAKAIWQNIQDRFAWSRMKEDFLDAGEIDPKEFIEGVAGMPGVSKIVGMAQAFKGLAKSKASGRQATQIMEGLAELPSKSFKGVSKIKVGFDPFSGNKAWVSPTLDATTGKSLVSKSPVSFNLRYLNFRTAPMHEIGAHIAHIHAADALTARAMGTRHGIRKMVNKGLLSSKEAYKIDPLEIAGNQMESLVGRVSRMSAKEFEEVQLGVLRRALKESESKLINLGRMRINFNNLLKWK